MVIEPNLFGNVMVNFVLLVLNGGFCQIWSFNVSWRIFWFQNLEFVNLIMLTASTQDKSVYR